jgi:transcription antitermination protein NusB
MAARHRSRRRALQVLFEWDMRKGEVESAIQHFYDSLYSEENPSQPKQDRFMEQLAKGTVGRSADIDKQIEAKSEHWRLERMPVVDRNILRLAIYELSTSDLPPPVIIDEALELARQFSSSESVSFINGVLDAIRRENLSARQQASV